MNKRMKKKHSVMLEDATLQQLFDTLCDVMLREGKLRLTMFMGHDYSATADGRKLHLHDAKYSSAVVSTKEYWGLENK